VLYDGVKNLLIVPILFFVGKWNLPQGVKTGLFLFLYAFLRIFIDIFREYPTTLFGLETGQVLNLLLSVLGLGLVIVQLWKHRVQPEAGAPQRIAALANPRTGGLTWRRLLFAAILLFALTMPSDWSQDVPARYGHRHTGLRHSVLYPKIP
jgi:hypothetical protein